MGRKWHSALDCRSPVNYGMGLESTPATTSS